MRFSIAFVVVVHKRWQTAEAVYAKLASRRKSPSTIYLIATAPSCIPGAVHDWTEAILLVPPKPLDIGSARHFAIESTSEDYVAFLDEDCVPQDLWFDAIDQVLMMNTEASDVVFGPRIELHSKFSIGGLIRRAESLRSRKYLAYRDWVTGTRVDGAYQLAGCVAGGNLVVRRATALELGISSTIYVNHTFEDVDFQLRALGANKTVIFMPSLVVHHDHPMSLKALAFKSIAAGRGLFLCTSVHGERLRAVCRWDVWGSAWHWMGLWGGLFLASQISFWSALGLFVATYVYFAGKLGPATALVWLVAKPVRDWAMYGGWVSAVLGSSAIFRKHTDETLQSDSTTQLPMVQPADLKE